MASLPVSHRLKAPLSEGTVEIATSFWASSNISLLFVVLKVAKSLTSAALVLGSWRHNLFCPLKSRREQPQGRRCLATGLPLCNREQHGHDK
jgi:hypothetical protein